MELKKHLKALSVTKRGTILHEQLVDDLISSFGGCLAQYENLLGSESVEEAFLLLKQNYIEQLKSALNLQTGQLFSAESRERYALLQSIARGEKVAVFETPAAKYLLAQHGDIPPFLAIHPEGYLIFALPMAKQSLKEIELSYGRLKRFFG